MKLKFALLVFFILSSCATIQSEIIKKTYEPKKTVVVEYFSEGLENQLLERAQNATDKAKDFCGTTPKLISEEKTSRYEGSLFTPYRHDRYLDTKKYIQLTFSCE